VPILALLGACQEDSRRELPQQGRRVTVSDATFMACGYPVWFNGANTPWDQWNDFGGDYRPEFWEQHFALMSAAGMNATRVWLSCDGEEGIKINAAGHVSGATQAHWAHLDHYFDSARNQGLFVMATLLSFDHFKPDKVTTKNQRWLAWIHSDDNQQSYISNYLLPFLERYGDNPSLWSIDLTNEPDWATEKEGGPVAVARFQRFFAHASAAIHANSDVLVTVGIGVIKHNSATVEVNWVSDAGLRKHYDHADARLDFWSPHHYDWQNEWFGVAHYQQPLAYGLTGDRPALIGECSAQGSAGHTLEEDYRAALSNGWQGVLAWTSNGVDTHGGLEQMIAATTKIAAQNSAMIQQPCH